jgi:glutathione S-transferase
VAYALHGHDLEAGTHKLADFLMVNPGGKVPALVDRGPDGNWYGVVVTEVAAIAAYVADLVPAARLAPPIGSADRAAYQFWMTYGPGAAEPAMMDMAFPRATPPPAMAQGWPPFPEVLARIETALEGRPFLLGEDFSAADLVVGGLLCFCNQIGMLRAGPNIMRYVARLEARPARQRAMALGEPAS